MYTGTINHTNFTEIFLFRSGVSEEVKNVVGIGEQREGTSCLEHKMLRNCVLVGWTFVFSSKCQILVKYKENVL